MTPLCQTVLRSSGVEEPSQIPDDETDAGLSRNNTFYDRSEQVMSPPDSPRLTQYPQHKAFHSSKPEKRSESAKMRTLEKGTRSPPYAPAGEPKGSSDGTISDFYVFLPYLHFETYKERQEMFRCYKKLTSTHELGCRIRCQCGSSQCVEGFNSLLAQTSPPNFFFAARAADGLSETLANSSMCQCRQRSNLPQVQPR